MPYRFNAITGKLDLVEILQVEAGITALGSDAGTAAPVAGLVNILGDAGQGSTTSATDNNITVTNTDATETQVGVTALASDAEAIDGTVANKAIVPTSLNAKLGTQTAEGIPFGQGDDAAINWTDPLADGQIVIGATGGDPTASTLTAGTGVTIVNGPNSITINSEAEGDLTFQTGNGSTQPVNDVITFAGATSIDMSAVGGIVSIDFDVTDSPEIATNYVTDNGISIPISNSLSIIGGNDIATSSVNNVLTIDFTGAQEDLLFLADNGTAIPINDIIIILGDQLAISTRAQGNILNIDFDVSALGSIPVAFATDNAVAQPVDNVLDISGGNNISTRAVGSEVIIDFTGEPTELTFAGDTGTALAVNDIINIIGSSSGIVTSASADTIAIDFDVSQSPEIPTQFLTDVGSARALNNNIAFEGGQGISISGSGSAVTVHFTGSPTDLNFTTSDGTATADQGNINFTGTQGITPSGSNDTVNLGFDVSQSPEICTRFFTDFGNGIPNNNNISFRGDNDISITAEGSIISIGFTGDPSDLNFNTNNGIAQSDSGTINILGGSPEGVITTRGFNDNILIDFNPNFFPQIPTQFTGDIGTAIPADNNLNIVGGSNIIVQGIDDQLTINFTGEGTGLTFGSDQGSAEPDVDGLINLFGTPTGIETFASGNAIGFSFDINGQPTIANDFEADVGNATPTFNNLKLLGGNNIQTIAANDSVTFNFVGSPTGITFGTDSGTTEPDSNGLINLFGTPTGIGTFFQDNSIGFTFDINGQPTIPNEFQTDAGSATPTFNSLRILGGPGIQTVAQNDAVTITNTQFVPDLEDQLNAIFAGLRSIHDSGVDLPLETQQWILKNVV